MKKSELLSIFKQYLNSELRTIVREELSNVLLGDNPTASTQQPIPETRTRKRKKPAISEFKNLGILGDALNETMYDHESIAEEEAPNVPATYGVRNENATVATDITDAKQPAGNLRAALLNKMGIDTPAVAGQPVSLNEMLPDDRKHMAQADPDTTDFLTKDYSGIIQAWDKKDKKKGL